MDAFPYLSVPNKWTLSRPMNSFVSTESMHDRQTSGWPLVLSQENVDFNVQTSLFGPENSVWDIT